jgi:hypothetical protein
MESTLINSEEFKKELTNILKEDLDRYWYLDESENIKQAVKDIIILLNNKLSK